MSTDSDGPGELTLFDVEPVAVPAAEPVERLSAGRRRTIRQRADVTAGRHPLTGGRLHVEADRRCGNCRFRETVSGDHEGRFPKCTYGNGVRMTGGPATDVRAWWPACPEHERPEGQQG